MDVKQVTKYLSEYDGRPLKFMEVCGTHTSSIFRNGIRSLISPKIKLISGPGCPVCVTPAEYIDRCVEYATSPGFAVCTFGDMIKVPGTDGSLADAKGRGANVRMIYSPLEMIDLAEKDPGTTYVMAAVGFETTVPVYALAIEEAARRGVGNVKFVTALKTIIPALRWICENDSGIDGFLCPGHVSVITGTGIYEEIASGFGKPCVVAGFEAEHILAAVYDLVRQTEAGTAEVRNLYRNAVRPEGNLKALEMIDKYFEPADAVWRGLGKIAGSGLCLRPEYAAYDGGSRGLDRDRELPAGCRCADVITGRIDPDKCPVFGRGCDPVSPYGPCMVSAEGACGIWYRNRGV